MRRRAVLRNASVGLGALAAGCSGLSGTTGDPETTTRTPGEQTSRTSPEPTTTRRSLPWEEPCGAVTRPVSERLLNEPDPEHEDCNTPSGFVVANERESAVEAWVTVSGNPIEDEHDPGMGPENEPYRLDAGERNVVSYTDETAFHTAEGTTVTVDVWDETYTETWSGASCYRSAVVIGPDGIEVGWLEPVGGLGDPQHSCYAGDVAGIGLHNERPSESRITVSVERPCLGTSDAVSVSLPGGESYLVDDLLVSGGHYLGTVSLADGPERSFAFPGAGNCWGMNVFVTSDADIEIHPVGIA